MGKFLPFSGPGIAMNMIRGPPSQGSCGALQRNRHEAVPRGQHLLLEKSGLKVWPFSPRL